MFFFFILSWKLSVKSKEDKDNADMSFERSLCRGLYYYHNFIQEKSDACPWKAELGGHNRDHLSIVHSPLHSLTHRSAAHLLSAPEHRQIILSEPPSPTRVSVGGSIFSIFVAYVMLPWMSINGFYSHDPFAIIAFFKSPWKVILRIRT